jgi:hypothetical protein
MKTIISILILLISIPVYSESKMDSLIRLSNERLANKNTDSSKNEDVIKNIDTTIQLAKDCGNILQKEVKQYGLKKTIQINSDLFFPIVIFIILFLIWLKAQKKV